MLHAIAAVGVPAFLSESEVIRSGNLVVFVLAEAVLAVLAASTFVISAARPSWLRPLVRIEGIGTAINFGALAWLGPDVASSTPSKFLLLVALVAITGIGASFSSILHGRRTAFVRSMVIIGTAHVTAYLVSGELILAAFATAWCVSVYLFSGVGLKAMEELLELRRQSEEAARYDHLTQALNRPAFMDALERSAASGDPAVLLLLDLDGFKAVNDSYGHATGDAVLRAVAERLRRRLPPASSIGRLGGDELSAIIPTEDIEVAAQLDRVAAHVAEAITAEGRSVYVAGSIGWTYVRGGVSARDLIAEADAAMYESKNSTTTSISGFTPALRDQLELSLELRQRFRAAVRGQGISFEAQPVVSTEFRRPVAVELLARWPDESGDGIAPDAFNQLANETGLALELDCQALRAGARLLRGWRDDPDLSSLVVKVNISPSHLEHRTLVHSIVTIVDEADRHRLGVEFIETELLAASSMTKDLLLDLSNMGVTVSIDDFGTGYSSLAYLRSVPVSEIKIDRTFVRAVDRDPVNRGLVQAVVDVARTLGLSTIAEGVERPEEFDEVARLGVSAVQGYLTGRPAAVDEISAKLRAAMSDAGASG
ncbi:MAG: GGDEF and EAL domain-containing protein [Actinomycetota bacterium]